MNSNPDLNESSSMDSKKRFSNRVDNYVKYRPGYPPSIITYLADHYQFTPDWIVADIGSGTGLSSRLFMDNGNTVYGVEPNKDMRAKAEEMFNSLPGRFISVDGQAEQTSLPAGSIDLILAGQAFHWFDPAGTRQEWSRISCKEGIIALLWNERLIQSGLEKEYEELLHEYGSDYAKVNHRNITDKEIAGFFHPQRFQVYVTPNDQHFDWEGLKGRTLSSSYMPDEKSPQYGDMIQKLESIFQKHQKQGRVTINYSTRLYTGPAQ